MTKREKAVAVAKDVLKQLKAETMQVACGDYVRLGFEDSAIPEVKQAKELQEVLPKAKSCLVCAMGAAFVSYAKLFDNVPMAGKVVYMDLLESVGCVRGERPSIEKVLRRIITLGEVTSLENAFEAEAWSEPLSQTMLATGRLESAGTPKYMEWAAFDYGKSLSPEPKERLAALMRNIIRNKGYFKVPEKFVKRAKGRSAK